MNQFVPDWTSNMGDAFAPLGVEDDGLMELLWCNGHVVMQSQAPRKPAPRAEKEAEAASAWFQYPVEDSLERDLFSELFGEAPADTGGRACKAEEAAAAAATAPPQSRLMPPPKKACLEDADCAAVAKKDAGADCAAAAETGGESSMLTIGSSFCGSNHVQTTPHAAPPARSGKAGGARARDAATVTSSSMQQPRSCAAAKAGTPAAHRGGKRKQRDDAAATEDAEFESAAVTCEPAQKTTTAKRRRAAEVHNLSERRRRGRINEKMKALQELIPHCNKTDKASMLDEAIEYLKSLQLQVMWMGGGMAAAAAPVMFPAAGVHQYMQRVVGPPHVASMPRMPPFMAQSPPVADPYARCLAAVESLQPPGPMHYLQGMNFYQQQSPAPPLQPLPAATAPTFPSHSTPHRKHESSSKIEINGANR